MEAVCRQNLMQEMYYRNARICIFIIKAIKQKKMKYSEPKKVVIVATGRNLIFWTMSTRTTEENNLFLPHGSCMDYNSLFTKLIILQIEILLDALWN